VRLLCVVYAGLFGFTAYVYGRPVGLVKKTGWIARPDANG
jgi:hypothetical protein